MPKVLTIREAVERAKSEGFPISEYSLRRWLKVGAIPARKTGRRILLYYPNLIDFLKCQSGCDNPPPVSDTGYGVIRRIEP